MVGWCDLVEEGEGCVGVGVVVVGIGVVVVVVG